jgi:hypothetical protein
MSRRHRHLHPTPQHRRAHRVLRPIAQYVADMRPGCGSPYAGWRSSSAVSDSRPSVGRDSLSVAQWPTGAQKVLLHRGPCRGLSIRRSQCAPPASRNDVPTVSVISAQGYSQSGFSDSLPSVSELPGLFRVVIPFANAGGDLGLAENVIWNVTLRRR